jgi:hypothetical protein
MNITVHIERLILEGLPLKGGDGAAVQAAVETELARLLTEKGLSRMSTGAAPNVSAGPVALAKETKPADLGHQIARAIYASLGPAPALVRPRSSSGGITR